MTGKAQLDGYGRALAVEEAGRKRLEPFLDAMTDKWESVNDREFQMRHGDYRVWVGGQEFRVEAKCEPRDRTGNFFLETWSNLTWDRTLRKPGWMQTLETDILAYYFLNDDYCGRLFTIPFEKLCRWAWGKDGMHRFPLKEQHKNEQKNLAVGHCVDFETVRLKVGYREYHRSREDGRFECVSASLFRPTGLPF